MNCNCSTYLVNSAVVPPVGSVIVAVEPGPHLEVSVHLRHVAVVAEHLLVLVVVVVLHPSSRLISTLSSYNHLHTPGGATSES